MVKCTLCGRDGGTFHFEWKECPECKTWYCPECYSTKLRGEGPLIFSTGRTCVRCGRKFSNLGFE